MNSSKKRHLMEEENENNVNISNTAGKKTVKKDLGFVEGAIVRIKLENILTYDSVEFNTGPFLNVIIGPNGTGKSTIVCAICLGLAGKTAWLGRASLPADFIKYGHERGKIELELYNPKGENHIIQREILKDKSLWTVNGRKANIKSVELMVSNLNIQVGNLCQFLPQDRVAEFAKMTQQELLENTQKAVSEDLYELHQKLKEARKDSRQMEQSCESVEGRLQQEQQKNSRLEQDVKNFEERQIHLEKVRVLKMKRPWVEYEEKRKQYLEEKKLRDEKEEEVKQARSQHEPLQEKMETARRAKDDFDAQMKRKSTSIKDCANKVRDSSQQLESLTDKIADVQKDLDYKQQEEDSRKRKAADMRNQLQAMESELAQVDDVQDHQQEAEKLAQEMRGVNQEMTQVQHSGNTIRMEMDNIRREIQGNQQELNQIQDISRRRLETLRQRHRHTYDAVMWLRENKNLFCKKIYEPMILCLNMKNAGDARYVENHISFNDLRAFVCEDPNDLDLFMSTMRDEQRLKVNVVKMPVETVESFQPPHSLAEYSKFGFSSFLKDLFDCPDAVMRFLCMQYQVHKIVVGDERVKSNVNRVIQKNPELHVFYTKDTQYTIKRSRYGNKEISARNTKLREPVFLAVSMDAQRQHELRKQIQTCQLKLQGLEEQYSSLQSKSKDLESHMNKLREIKKDVNKRKDQKKRLQYQINTKKESIQRIEAETIDMDIEAEKARKMVQEIAFLKCGLLKQLCVNTRKCFELSQEKVQLSLKHSGAIYEYTSFEAELRDQSQSLQGAERHLQELKEGLKRTRAMAKTLLDRAKVATGTGPNEELSPDLKKAFEQCPPHLDEIDAQIHEQQARADCTFQVDERVVREFQQRKKEIHRLQCDLEKRTRERDNHHHEIEEAKRNWLGPLRELIHRINDNFGYFFTCMKCTGEVDISIPENPEDYEKYGVRIKVKYRDGEPLRELTPHHQSGGERSVATVLYMMALQELAKSPFRCVDEINQGMDPINERKVFELVVQTVCKKSTSQYFLLTPKLLPDLEYADNMTVLGIYSGPHMMNHTEWNVRKFLRRREKLSERVV
ncbi:structural maintenance of chromosomes protein 5-like [Haliotis asinina]|uniref:structural maintenance of chromosomes protein 5-like n=1 Tax=Haliotis asinina TaxID=109174 RepID=UPI003531F339